MDGIDVRARPDREIDRWLREAHRVFDDHRGDEHSSRPHVTEIRGSVKRVLARYSGMVDQVTLRAMEPWFLSGGRPSLDGDIRQRIEDAKELYGAAELYQNPDLFFRRLEEPSEFRVRRLNSLPKGRRLRLTYLSNYEVFDKEYEEEFHEYRANRVSYVHFWRHDDVNRPTVICVHPWCLGHLRVDEKIFAARSLYRMGMNVALFTMPFHGKRTPRQALFSGQLFPSRHIQRTNEAFGQAVADLRVLISWLRDGQKTGPIGIMGFSLGGYTSALMASLEPSLLFSIPIIAPATFADLMWHHGEGRRRREAEQMGMTLWDLRWLLGIHSPLMHKLRIPQERVHLIWGTGDRIVPSVHQLALWEHWGRPKISTFLGGHMFPGVTPLGRVAYLRDIKSWLKELGVI